jgi:hypothetical protein
VITDQGVHHAFFFDRRTFFSRHVVALHRKGEAKPLSFRFQGPFSRTIPKFSTALIVSDNGRATINRPGFLHSLSRGQLLCLPSFAALSII